MIFGNVPLTLSPPRPPWIWMQNGSWHLLPERYIPPAGESAGDPISSLLQVLLLSVTQGLGVLWDIRGMWQDSVFPLTSPWLLLHYLKLCYVNLPMALGLIHINPPVLLVWKARESQAVTTDLREWRTLSLLSIWHLLLGFPCALKLRIPFLSVELSRNAPFSALSQWVNMLNALESRWLK